jgi:hypothetical protein
MPWGAIASAAASIGGSLLSGGGGGGGGYNANMFGPSPGQLADQNTNITGMLSSDFNLVNPAGNNPYSQLAPYFQQLFQSGINSPQAGGYQQAANTAGGQYGQVGNMNMGNAGALSAAGLGAIPAAYSTFNMAFDPQSALYNQMLQKTNDQANVSNAQYGLTGQQAAGNVQQADTNFNIDWQNQQLQRALSGLSGLDKSLGATAGTLTQAGNIGSAGAGATEQAGSVPYGAQQSMLGNQNTALNSYLASLYGPTTGAQSTIGDILQYLGYGNSAAQTSSNIGAQNLANNSAGAAGLAGLGGQFGALAGNLFGGGSNPSQVSSSGITPALWDFSNNGSNVNLPWLSTG